MKRLLLICVIFLLTVSGWGQVLAAVFCPSMQDMPGCSMPTGSTSASSHEGMEMDEMQMKPTIGENEAKAIKEPLSSCCLRQPEVPPSPAVVSRSKEQTKQDPGAVAQPARKALAPQARSFAPPISSRQHAPPGASTPRYVLVNVFLI